MRRSVWKVLVVALFATIPLLTSCADQDLSAPEVPQQQITAQGGLIGDLIEGVVGVLTGTLQLVAGGNDAQADPVQAWIGASGGVLRSGAYELVVPAGAVSEPTLFKMTPSNDGLYSVQLKAYRRGLLGLVMYDVGGKGFRKPVVLTMSYAGAKNLKPDANLVIVYITDSGELKVQFTLVDEEDREASSPLWHFSRYALAQN